MLCRGMNVGAGTLVPSLAGSEPGNEAVMLLQSMYVPRPWVDILAGRMGHMVFSLASYPGSSPC